MFSTYIFKESFSSSGVFVQKIISVFLLLLTVVFGSLQVSGQSTWTKIANHTDVTSTDEYLIVDVTSNRALTSANGTGSAPSAVAVTITGGGTTISLTSAEETNLAWKFELVGSEYIIKKASNPAVWLYATNTNNGVRVGTDANNKFILNETNSTNYKGFKHEATSRYIGVYNSQDWRCYTGNGTSTNIGYTKIEIFKKVPSCSTPVLNALTSQTVTEPSGATFGPVTGTNITGATTYQWEYSTDNGSTWSNAPGASTAASYNIASTTVSMNGNQYRVKVSNTNACQATSNAATLTVNPPAGTYTVTFDPNGGTGSMSPQLANSATNLTLNTFTNTGYSFNGWNTAADGSGTAYANGASYPFTSNVTLYAQWSPNNNTLIFNANGGTGSMANVTMATGSSMNLPANTFTRSGYNFDGWGTSAGGSVSFADGASYTMSTASSYTLYAIWSCAVPNAPSGTISVVDNCGNSVFTYSGGSAGENLYWQTSASGTSTTNGGNTYTENAGSGTRHLRNYNSIGNCWSTSISASFSVISNVAITTQPTSQNATVGNGATFTVSASNAGGYQWQEEIGGVWTNMSGQTSSTLTLSGLTLADNGRQFRVIVSGNAPCGAVTSNVVTLSVSTGPCYASHANNANSTSGSINTGDTDLGNSTKRLASTSNPGSLIFNTTGVNVGNIILKFRVKGWSSSETQMTINLNGTPVTVTDLPTSFDWYTINLTTTVANPVLILSTIQNKRVHIGNVEIYCPPTCTPATISTNPVSASISPGNNVILNFAGAGYTTAQWQTSTNGTTWTDLIGEINTSYSTPNLNTTTYYRVVLDAGTPCEVISSIATITVSSITVNPISNQTSVYGDAINTTLTTVNYTSPTTVTYSATLPAGLSINASTGLITGTLTQSVASSPFASSITVTPAAGSAVTINFTWTITPKTLTVNGASVTSKPFDGNTNATITGTLNGIVSPDVVTITGGGTFATANAGTGIAVTSNLSLSGADAGNYTLTQPTGLVGTITKVAPTITPNPVSVTIGGNVTLVSNSDGAITLSNVPSIVSNSGTTITGVSVGTGTVDVSVAEGTNHLPGSFTIPVTVVSFPNGTYRTTSSGTWPAGSATWERLQSGSWVVATPSDNTSDLLIIRDSIVSRTSFSTTNGTLMLVENGGVFNGLHNSTFQNLTVKNGGKFYVSNPGVSITNVTGQLTVEDGGTLILNSPTLDNGDGLWKGVENFYPNSTVIIKNWDWDASSNTKRFIDNSISANSNGYLFGNLIFDASPSENFSFFANTNSNGGNLMKFVEKNLTIKNNAAATIYVQLAIANQHNIEIGGDVIVENGGFRFAALSSSSVTHLIKGNIIQNGGNIQFNPTLGGSSVVNLLGNLQVSSNATFGGNQVGSKLIFSGTSPQTLSVAGNLGQNILFEIDNNAYVSLINQDFNLTNTSNEFTVKNGGILNFNHFDILGNGSFDLQTNGKIIITSPDGIMTSGATGNVQTTTRNFANQAVYHYVGQVNQTSGTALPIASADKKIIVELLDNNTVFTVNTSGAVEISSNGELEIRKGTLIDAGGAASRAIQGSGSLIMSDGIYQFIDNVSSSTSTTYYPRLSGNYTLNGGTVELASSQTGSQYQRLRGSRIYHNILISGSSTGGAYKDVSSAIVVNNNFSIVGSPIFDAGSNGITGDAGLTMTGGLYRTSRLTNSQPELAGISTPYTLTGGTIEFYGSSNSSSQNIRNKYGANVDIHYHNIEINSLSSNYNYTSGNVSSSSIVVDGTMNVNAPAVYRLANGFNVSGLGTFNLNSGATLFFGSVGGISTLNNTGAIRTSNKIFSPESSFGFISTGNQSSGNAFPSSIRNLHVLNNADVIFNSSLEVKDSLIMNGSNLDLGINTLTLGNSQVRKGELYRTSGFVIGKMERWFGNVNSGTVSGLFPIAVMESGNLRNRFVQVDYTTAATTGDKLLVEFMSTPMGFSGLPISASNSGGAGFDILTTEDQGYWRIDPASGGLSDGVYTISLTGEGYSTITNLTELTLLKRVNGGNWTAPGTHIAATGSIGVPTVTRSGVTGWSNFGFGGGFNNPLPVELTSLSIVCDNNSKNIVWSTATEYNASHFDVEYSYDMTEWKYLGSVQAKGNSITTTNYSLLDLENRNQIVYYRLNQYDFDGESTVYGPISELCQEGLFDLSIYPNPNNGVFTLQVVSQEVKENVELSIISLDGRLTKSKSLDLLSGVNTFPFSMVDLSTGIYIVKLKVDNEFSSYIKFTVK